MVRYSVQKQCYFINLCIDWWWKHWVDGSDYFPEYHLEMIHWVYRYAVSKEWFDIPIHTFQEYVLKKSHVVVYTPTEEKPKTKFWFKWALRHSVSRKYQKGEGHGKRHGVEEKQLWRKVSGKDRDCRKRHFSRGPMPYYKKLRSEQHRAWVKQVIHNEDWDKFNNKEREQFVDPWSWD